MTKTRITAARDVVVGNKILMNGTFWETTDVVPGEVLTVIYATYGGALLTLRAPNDLTVSVEEAFYPGRFVEILGRQWTVRSVTTTEGVEWVHLTHGTTYLLDIRMDALRVEMS